MTISAVAARQLLEVIKETVLILDETEYTAILLICMNAVERLEKEVKE